MTVSKILGLGRQHHETSRNYQTFFYFSLDNKVKGIEYKNGLENIIFYLSHLGVCKHLYHIRAECLISKFLYITIINPCHMSICFLFSICKFFAFYSTISYSYIFLYFYIYIKLYIFSVKKILENVRLELNRSVCKQNIISITKI